MLMSHHSLLQGVLMNRLRLFLSLPIFLLLFASAGTTAADVEGCPVLPADNVWNRDISLDPVHPNSTNYINNINNNGGGAFVHPDFGDDPSYGIPWTTATNSTQTFAVDFGDEAESESDPGPY